MNHSTLIPSERVTHAILFIRGQKVMLDHDLATLYGVETKVLVRSVQRNIHRFPKDFMFQLTRKEFENLRCQFGTSRFWGGRRYRPYAFTEQGVAMLSSVLSSRKAIAVNIAIMRAFVKIREVLSANKELAEKLKELESKLEKHDADIHNIFDAIRQLMAVQEKPKRQIGFHTP